MQSPVNKLVKHLQQQGLTLALAESVTCGLAAYKLSSVKGTSNVLRASLVCYQPETKNQLLGVPNKLIEQYTCESRQVTEALVKGLKRKVKADVYAAVTGLAAPGGSESIDKPVGTIFLSVSYKGKIYTIQPQFRGSPSYIKSKACVALFQYILAVVSV